MCLFDRKEEPWLWIAYLGMHWHYWDATLLFPILIKCLEQKYFLPLYSLTVWYDYFTENSLITMCNVAVYFISSFHFKFFMSTCVHNLYHNSFCHHHCSVLPHVSSVLTWGGAEYLDCKWLWMRAFPGWLCTLTCKYKDSDCVNGLISIIKLCI